MTWWNAHRDLLNSKGLLEHTCACCGKHFMGYERQRRKFCSHACYIAYPRCFMSIHRVNGFTLDEVVQGLIIQEDIEGAVNEDDLNGQPMKVLRMCEGTTAKSRVVEYNCLSLNDGGVLIVEMDWFVEAEGGIGARLLAMRDTIQLAPSTATAVQP